MYKSAIFTIADASRGPNHAFEALKSWDDVTEVTERFLFKLGVDGSGSIATQYIVDGYDGGCTWLDRNARDVRAFLFTEFDLDSWLAENPVANS